MNFSFLAMVGSKVWCQRFLSFVVTAGLLLGGHDCAKAAMDFGSWNVAGTGTYLNGDTIAVNLGPNTGFFDNTFSSNAVGAPFDQPGASQYFHVANNIALPSWTVTMDLSDYSVSSQTVVAFANLGAGIFSDTQTASIVFRDGASNPLSLTSATFLGSFKHQWAGATFDEAASFDLNTGTWSYAANNGLNVDGASAIFFLTNLPTNAASIEFTVNNPANSPNYILDSVFIAVGSPIIPEPCTMVLALPAIALVRRRKRGPLSI